MLVLIALRPIAASIPWPHDGGSTSPQQFRSQICLRINRRTRSGYLRLHHLLPATTGAATRHTARRADRPPAARPSFWHGYGVKNRHTAARRTLRCKAHNDSSDADADNAGNFTSDQDPRGWQIAHIVPLPRPLDSPAPRLGISPLLPPQVVVPRPQTHRKSAIWKTSTS